MRACCYLCIPAVLNSLLQQPIYGLSVACGKAFLPLKLGLLLTLHVDGCSCSIAADLSCFGVSTVVVDIHTQMEQTLPVMCQPQTSSCWTPMGMAALPWPMTRMRHITQ